MISADLAKIWSIALAALMRQPPFLQILMVAVAALLVVMTIEGFRTSLIAIWRGHRPVPSLAPNARPQALASATPLSTPFAPTPPAKIVVAKSAATVRKRKPLTANPKAFRSPRPTIKRHPAPFTEFANSYVNAQVYAAARAVESI